MLNNLIKFFYARFVLISLILLLILELIQLPILYWFAVDTISCRPITAIIVIPLLLVYLVALAGATFILVDSAMEEKNNA